MRGGRRTGPRLLAVYGIALAVVVLSEPTPLSTGFGAALLSCGAALRWWGAGHLVKTDRLTVSGPYAHLQHPLYTGSLLVASGFALIAGPVGLSLLAGCVFPLFFYYYLPYKDRIESARLERRYGAAYAAYRDAVPRLWPALSAYSPPGGAAAAERRWSRERARENGEAGVSLLLAGLLLLLLLRPALRLG